ncbi:hypothetical protein ALC62_07638 [Cyphomyrmex costatus]|uniref:Uncharacterized protein n=1 Tax=Cyphomyrmex costatus TaxID=456900 RepID=A0A195CL53_9HYME|nr:hypothetical protein ALC62_07638 [Cyphomyrmex costatus]
MEREWGARRGRETTEKQHDATRKANVEVREDARLKVFGIDGTGKSEREVKETKEKETGIDSVPRYEARRNNMRRRTASTRSRIGVAGAVPTSLLPHSGAPIAAWATPISPTAMATSCDNGVRQNNWSHVPTDATPVANTTALLAQLVNIGASDVKPTRCNSD